MSHFCLREAVVQNFFLSFARQLPRVFMDLLPPVQFLMNLLRTALVARHFMYRPVGCSHRLIHSFMYRFRGCLDGGFHALVALIDYLLRKTPGAFVGNLSLESLCQRTEALAPVAGSVTLSSHTGLEHPTTLCFGSFESLRHCLTFLFLPFCGRLSQ